MKTKVCSKCKKSKPLSDFYTDSRHVDGLRSQCKQCQLTTNKKWNRNNQEKVNTSHVKFYTNHPNYQYDWAKANQERVKESKKKWRINNPDYDSHKWMREHPEQSSIWKGNNPEQYKILHNKATAKRKRNLGWELLFNNPFPPSIPVDYHHISDGFVVAIPRSLHKRYLGKNHRLELKPYVESIYDISYTID